MTIHSLLTPENSTMIFIDHQPQMTFGVAVGFLQKKSKRVRSFLDN
jgi:hypothetical protein